MSHSHFLHRIFIGSLFLAAPLLGANVHGDESVHMNVYDRERSEEMQRREADWRNGAIVYQVIVDRFAPPANLEAKRDLYPAPKRLRSWDESPSRGEYLEEVEVWSHEIDFWGGDLDSLRGQLDYIANLGVDVLYLNPIHLAYTNHKYDAQDYKEVSPEYGTRDDVGALAEAVHDRGMKLVLDGVFNHMGRTSPYFQEALQDPDSPWREFYYIGPEYELGYRAWVNVPNLPELNLESQTVRDYVFGAPDSVIQGYMRQEKVDGWRLDVAFDIGFRYLSELTESAHEARPGSVVIGEVWNYPEEWMPALDGVMNMTGRELVLKTVQGRLEPQLAGVHFERMVNDTGIEPLLKSWIILDNHDTPRLATSLPETWQQRMAQVLQFTLPGSPCVYYGVEVGMTGGDDPEQRGPMRWDLASEDNETLTWTKNLIAERQSNRALRIGDFRLLDSAGTLAYLRRTTRAADTTVVIANPGEEPVHETLLVRESKFMSFTQMSDAFSDARFSVVAGVMELDVPPRTVYVLRPEIDTETIEYTPYKRVH